MGSCNSGDHIAEDHIHTEITTFFIEKPQQKDRLRTVINKLLVGGGEAKHILRVCGGGG